jgi:hypothetical protein
MAKYFFHPFLNLTYVTLYKSPLCWFVITLFRNYVSITPILNEWNNLTIVSKSALISKLFFWNRFSIQNIRRQQWHVHSFVFFLFMKIRFKGKGYYLYKNRRHTLAFRFGFGHRNYVYNHEVRIRNRPKLNLILWSRNWFQLWDIALATRTIRPINIFTGRGIRFNKQIVYRKTGKISTYR